jgi:hypothetical protein
MRVQPATAVPAGGEALQQGGAFSHGAAWPVGMRMEVAIDARLIGFVRLPVDEAFVVVGEEDRPFGARQPADSLLDGAVGRDVPLAARSTIDVGTSVYRIGEHVVNRGVRRRHPADAIDAVGLQRERQPFGAKPEPDLAHRAEFSEAGKDGADRAGHRFVGMGPDFAVVVAPHKADWQATAQLAAGGLVANATVEAGAEDMQLGFTHRAFEAEDQPVVEQGRVVHAVSIADQSVGQAAQIQEAIPVGGVVAREARDLEAQDDADLRERDVGGFERKGVETSLLPRLTDKTLTMKDFTTVLTMYRETRAEILAQLREIYDGSYAKEWGNGKSFRWQGKVGLLAGVTPAIDREYAMHQIMGERFLLYRVKSASSRSQARRAIAQSSAAETDQRQGLRTIVASFLDHVVPMPPPMSADITEAIAALAEFTAVARSPIIFDQRGEIEYIPTAEAPGRLAKQFALLARALAIVRGERDVGLSTYVTVSQVAQDTLPAQRQVMLEVLLGARDGVGDQSATGLQPRATVDYASPWPDFVDGLGRRTVGPYSPCSSCGRGSWVRFGETVLCLQCAQEKR